MLPPGHPSTAEFAGSSAALASGALLVEDWLRRYERSALRLPRPVDLRELVAPARGVIAALELALAEPGGAAPGSPALREAEKLVAFTGGNLGSANASAFDVFALCAALRDALVAHAADAPERSALAALFDWLTALALEGYASSRLDGLRIRNRDSLEKGTPVVMLAPELPAVLLVGEPERSVLDAVFGRLLLAIARAGARTAIVDGGGLRDALAGDVLDALAAFARHPRVAAMRVVLSGLPSAAEPRWLERFAPGAAVALERFDDAVASALQVAREKGGSA